VNTKLLKRVYIVYINVENHYNELKN